MITGSMRHASASEPPTPDEPEAQREDDVDEQAHDDGRHAGHDHGEEPDELGDVRDCPPYSCR